MQAVVMHETGNPDVLRYEQAERPEPGDGEVLIKVRAASVNAVDWKYRRGLADKQLPAVLGNDVSGTVEVSRAEGAEVFGFAASGGYADFATASAAMIARKPAAVNHEQAAAIVLGLGAQEYIDYTQQDVAEAVSGVDMAFDTVGGETTQSLLPTLREGGILVTIAAAPPTEAAQERGVRAELLVTSPSSKQLTRIADLVAAGDVRVELAAVIPLTEVRRAHELSESGHTRGKIVLTVAT